MNKYELIRKYILNLSLTEEEKIEAEAMYMAMCMLIPKESFLNEVNKFGGLEYVILYQTYQDAKMNTFGINLANPIEFLANIFAVDQELIRIRLRELYNEENSHNYKKYINFC